MLSHKRQKAFKIEIARRTSASTWGPWEDITRFLIKRKSDISIDLDDVTLRGRVQQSSCIFEFNNRTGAFNPEGTEGSLWNGANEYVYHSRFRYYEIYLFEGSFNEEAETDIKPLLDGLIATFPSYKENMTCDLTINSRLDILRDHYILENIIGRSKRASSQAIIKEVIDLFDNTYQELGVITTGGIFRKEIFYDNVTPYDQNLLAQMNQSVVDGGGIGGLRLYDNKLFFTYFGNEKTTRANFEDDANTLGLWLFDETDFNDGAGTTIRDQSSANSEDFTVATSITENGLPRNIEDPWQNGFFSHSSRAFYNILSPDPYPSLQNHSLEIIIKWEKNSNAKFDNTIMGGPPARLFHSVRPIWGWTQNNDAEPRLWQSQSATGGMPLPDYSFEGIGINYKNELIYFYAKHTDPENTVSSQILILEQVILTQCLGDGFYQNLALNFDYTNKLIETYINGKLQSTTAIFNLGIVFTGIKRKIVCSGFGFYNDSGSYFEHGTKWGKVYYSSIKLSNILKTESEIFQQYEKLFATTFSIKGTSKFIVDNFNNKLIEKVISYNAGFAQVKNYIILQNNDSAIGSYTYTSIETQTVIWAARFYFQDGGSIIVTAAWTEPDFLVADINSHSVLFANGIKAQLLRDVMLQNQFFSKAILIYTNGTIDYRRIRVLAQVPFSPSSDGFIGIDTSSNKSSPVTPTTHSFTLLPDGDNQTVFAKDAASILKYGKRIKRMENFDLIDSSQEKIDQLQAQLEQDKDPRARMTISVPFNYREVDIFDQIEVRLDPKQDSFRNEIGHYKSWNELEGYRTKDFYCVGIRHKRDGGATILKLLENKEIIPG